MPLVRVDANLITDWNTFHDVFERAFGFPGFYGRNMDAWIDCMSSIDDKESGMTRFWINKNDTLILKLTNAEAFKIRCFDIYLALFESVAFVNFRKCESDRHAMIAIAAA